MAMASRIFKEYEESAKYSDAAKKAWEYLDRFLADRIHKIFHTKSSWINIGIAEHESGLPESSRGILAAKVVELCFGDPEAELSHAVTSLGAARSSQSRIAITWVAMLSSFGCHSPGR